jgi:hypothetical protein
VRIPRNSSSGGRVKAAAKREMKGYAVGELRIPQLNNDGFGRELIGLKLEDGLKREGARIVVPDAEVGGRHTLGAEGLVERAIGREAESAAANGFSAARRNVISAIGLGLVLGIFFAWFIPRSITRPIRKVIDSLNHSADQVSVASIQIASSSQTLAEGANLHFSLGYVLNHFPNRVIPRAIISANGSFDIFGSCYAEFDLLVEEMLQTVNRVEIGRIGKRNGHSSLVHCDRDHIILLGDVPRDRRNHLVRKA